MTPQTDSTDGRWSVKSCPFTVEYSLAAMEGIRSAVVEGLYRLARGGIEVGGVLFGSREDCLVRIQAFRPLGSEYLTGPSYVLSEKDQEALCRMLETSREDPQLAGLVPVGWYHSHTRSGISLSGADEELYNRYFPEPWQVALVVHPERMKPVKAAFFFRETGGAIRAESSDGEFVIEPLGKKRESPGRTPAAEAKTGAELPPPERGAGRRSSRLWIDWLAFAAGVCMFIAGAALLARPYLFPDPPMRKGPDVRELIRQKDNLAHELDTLRAELEQKAAENRELQAQVEKLKERSTGKAPRGKADGSRRGSDNRAAARHTGSGQSGCMI